MNKRNLNQMETEIGYLGNEDIKSLSPNATESKELTHEPKNNPIKLKRRSRIRSNNADRYFDVDVQY